MVIQRRKQPRGRHSYPGEALKRHPEPDPKTICQRRGGVLRGPQQPGDVPGPPSDRVGLWRL